jgi:hypothetical protein
MLTALHAAAPVLRPPARSLEQVCSVVLSVLHGMEPPVGRYCTVATLLGQPTRVGGFADNEEFIVDGLKAKRQVDDNEKRVFALLAQLFMASPNAGCVPHPAEVAKWAASLRSLEDRLDSALAILAELCEESGAGSTFSPVTIAAPGDRPRVGGGGGAVRAAAAGGLELGAGSLEAVRRHPVQQLEGFARDLNEEKAAAAALISRLVRGLRWGLEDQAAWRTLKLDLMQTAWDAFRPLVLARKVLTIEGVNEGTFANIDRAKVQDVLRGMSEEEQVVAVDECHRVLREDLLQLSRIFKHYSVSGTAGNGVSICQGRFWQLVKDCAICSNRKTMPSVMVDLIFQKSTEVVKAAGAGAPPPSRGGGTPAGRLVGLEGELNPQQTVHAFLRIAAAKFKKGPLHERLARLLHEDVLPNAGLTDTAVFRSRITGSDVNKVMARYERILTQAFDVYAADDDSDNAVGNLNTMNPKELITMFRETKIIDAVVTEKNLQRVFAYVQQSGDDDGGGDGGLDGTTSEGAGGGAGGGGGDDGGEDEDDSEMSYKEFAEAMCAVALLKRPDPYLLASTRIEQVTIDWEDSSPSPHSND